MSENDWVPGNVNDRSITGFRIRHGSAKGPMSRKAYYALKKSGKGPRESYRGGVLFISIKAEADWDNACSDPKRSAKTRKRHHLRALKAGAASADSPNHISKTRRSKKEAPRAGPTRMPEHPKATQA